MVIALVILVVWLVIAVIIGRKSPWAGVVGALIGIVLWLVLYAPLFS